MDKNKCTSCGEAPHKCSCKNKEFTKAVIEIDNPEQITLMRRVVIPASMGDDTTVPPTIGKYHNVLLYYEANQKSYLYSSDGIPTQLVNGITNYEDAINLPQINGVTLLGDKSSSDLGLQGEISNIEQYARFFDTVADMKASTVLADGSYARTLGYYSANDGGEALYKITEAQPSTYYETLNSGLYAQLIPEDECINVKQFGCVGDGATDDTAKLAVAMAYGVANNLKIEFNGDETYLISSATVIEESTKSCFIDGHNATIKISGTGRPRMYTLECGTIDIRNLKFDGTGTTQDQFDQTVWNDANIYTALNLNGNNIELNNLSLSNWYGNGIRFYGNYKNVNINNVLIDNVGGHWYQNDTHDAFGDAFGFSGRTGTANINLTNVVAIGKYKGSTLSRIGLAFDYSSNKNDDYTYVNLENCSFINYDRCIHVENILGKMKINYNNGRILNNVVVFNYGNTVDQVYFSGDNLIIENHDGAYNGSNGFYRTTFDVKNSIINCAYDQALAMFGCIGTYENCIMNNVNKRLGYNAGKITIKNSTVNLSTLTQYLSSGAQSDFTWIGCTFNSTTAQSESTSGGDMNYASCILNNFIPHYTGIDLNNEIHMTDYTFTDNNLYQLQSATLYEGTTLISRPCMSRTFPINDIDLYHYSGYRSATTTAMPFVPTFDDTYLRPNSKYVLITVGHNSWAGIRAGKNFDNYYINTITTDSAGAVTVGATAIVGNPSTGGFNFTIDEANNTIAKAGNYATNCIQWLLPYYYKDYLKNQ